MATNNLNILANLKLQMSEKALSDQLGKIKTEIESKLKIDVTLNIKDVNKGVSEVTQGTKKISASFAVYKESLDKLIHSYKMKKISDEEFLQKSDQKIKKMSFEKLSWAEQEKIINLTSQAQKKYNTEQTAIASAEATRHTQAMQRANEMQAKIKQNMTQGKGQVYTREYSSPILGTNKNDIEKSISSAIKAFDADAKISKIGVKLNENMNLSTATVSWKDSLGKMIKETMKWKDVVDEQTGQVKRVFKTVSTDITNDMAKMQSANLKAVEDAKKLQQSQVKKDTASNNSLYNQKDAASASTYKAVEDSLKRIYSLKQQILDADSKGQSATSANLNLKLNQESLVYERASQNISSLGLQNEQRKLALMQTELNLQGQLNTAGARQTDINVAYQQKMQNSIAQMKVGKDNVFSNEKIKTELAILERDLGRLGTTGGKSIAQLKMQFAQLQTSVSSVSNTFKNVNKDGYGFIEMIGLAAKKVAIWGVSTTLIMQSFRTLQDAIKYIVEMNNAMTDLGKVTDFSAQQMEGLRQSAVETAQALGKSSADIMRSYAEIARIHKNTNDIVELGRVSAMASNVTSLTAQDASKSINTAMLTFKLGVSDAKGLLDQWNEIKFVSPYVVIHM